MVLNIHPIGIEIQRLSIGKKTELDILRTSKRLGFIQSKILIYVLVNGLTGWLNLVGGDPIPVKKTKVVLHEILEEEGEMGTSEIYEMLSLILYHGVTTNQLTNLLSRSPKIESIGFRDQTRNGFRIRERIWRLKK